jgi:hypothetical protein
MHHALGWVWPFEELSRCLPKVVDKRNRGVALHRVFDLVDVHRTFVREMVKHIECRNSIIAALLVPESLRGTGATS